MLNRFCRLQAREIVCYIITARYGRPNIKLRISGLFIAVIAACQPASAPNEFINSDRWSITGDRSIKNEKSFYFNTKESLIEVFEQLPGIRVCAAYGSDVGGASSVIRDQRDDYRNWMRIRADEIREYNFQIEPVIDPIPSKSDVLSLADDFPELVFSSTEKCDAHASTSRREILVGTGCFRGLCPEYPNQILSRINEIEHSRSEVYSILLNFADDSNGVCGGEWDMSQDRFRACASDSRMFSALQEMWVLNRMIEQHVIWTIGHESYHIMKPTPQSHQHDPKYEKSADIFAGLFLSDYEVERMEAGLYVIKKYKLRCKFKNQAKDVQIYMKDILNTEGIDEYIMALLGFFTVSGIMWPLYAVSGDASESDLARYGNESSRFEWYLEFLEGHLIPNLNVKHQNLYRRMIEGERRGLKDEDLGRYMYEC